MMVGRHEFAHGVCGSAGVPAAGGGGAGQVETGWEVVDASGWSSEQLAQAVGQVVGHRFDLATEIPLQAKLSGLLRVSTFWWGGAPYRRGWALDSPVGAGFGVAYAARAAGRVPSWAPLPVQYIDYTLWQRAQFGILMIRAV